MEMYSREEVDKILDAAHFGTQVQLVGDTLHIIAPKGIRKFSIGADDTYYNFDLPDLLSTSQE